MYLSPPDIIISSKNKKKYLIALGKDPKLMKAYYNPKYQLSLEEIKRYLLFRKNYEFGTGTIYLSNPSLLERLQEIIMSATHPSLEIASKDIMIKEREDNLPPFNVKLQIKDIKPIGNVKISKPIEKVYYDYDMRAKEGMWYLYSKGYDIERISRFLSIGSIGIKRNRKIVPTKYAITASDSIIGDNLLERVKYYPHLEEFRVFLGEHYGNEFAIIFIPSIFFYELREIIENKEQRKVETDYELFEGRKDYPSNTGGGYYAIRLPIIEYLEKIKRQSGVLILRKVKPSYYMSLGVWVLRESVRDILRGKYKVFYRIEDLMKFFKSYDITFYEELKRSRMIRMMKKQRKLF